MSKWERVSKMKFKHENVHLMPYPYICTLYLELNSFQRNISCGKSPWLCLGNFCKHLWSMSCVSLFLCHCIWIRESKTVRGMPVPWVWIGLKRVFLTVSYCLSKIPWIPLLFSNHWWFFSWYFVKLCPVAPNLHFFMSLSGLEPAHKCIWDTCFSSFCMTTFVDIENHTFLLCS